MAIENKALVLELVEWIAKQPRPYTEVMDAWRTSCPRLPVWEEAVDHGLVAEVNENGRGPVIHVTPAGRAFLDSERRP